MHAGTIIVMHYKFAVQWTPGGRIGPYLLESRIGGGAWERWKARDTRLGRAIAVKGLIEHRDRFEQEARAISALNRPNSDVGPDILVLEYTTGGPCSARFTLTRRSPGPADRGCH